MSSSRIPSPARSQGVKSTPRKYKSRGSRSVGSPARSASSVKLTTMLHMNSFVLSPMPTRRSILTDTTDIDIPRRRSWWKKLDENSREIMEVLNHKDPAVANNAIEEYIEVDVLSQEKKNYTLDMPESSDGESINSIVIPQRKLFTQKESKTQNKFAQIIDNRESLATLHKTQGDVEQTLNVGRKTLFGQGTKQRVKPLFPSALLNVSSNKTIHNKTKELAVADGKGQVKNLFGNRPVTKRKNIFADFIVSDSEDEIPEIQPKVFEFKKKLEEKRKSLNSRAGRESRLTSPTSSATDIEMDDWMLLPSSTMVDHQLEDGLRTTPSKRARLDKLPEVTESVNSESNSTSNKMKHTNKSLHSKSRSKTLTKFQEIDIDELVTSQTNMQELNSVKEKNKSVKETDTASKNKSHEKTLKEKSLVSKDHSKSKNKSNEFGSKLIDNEGDAKSKSIHKQSTIASKIDQMLQSDDDEDFTLIYDNDENDDIVNDENNINVSEVKVRLGNSKIQPKPVNESLTKELLNKSLSQNILHNVSQADKSRKNPQNSISSSNFNKTHQEASQIENNNIQKLHLNQDEDNKQNSSKYPEASIVEKEQAQYTLNKHDNSEKHELSPKQSHSAVESPSEEKSTNEERDTYKEALEEEQMDSIAEDDNDNNDDDQNVSEEQNNSEQEMEEDIDHEDENDDEDFDKQESEEEGDNSDEEVEQSNSYKENNMEDKIDANEDKKYANVQDVEELQKNRNNVEVNHNKIDQDEIMSEVIDNKNNVSNNEDQFDQADGGNKTLKTRDAGMSPNTTKPTQQYDGKVPSPEVIRQNEASPVESFSVQRRNTSVRKSKSIINNLNIRPSLAPVRESTGFSDGSRNSSVDGWDSHRTTRATLRQTFGKDFTPRKSLRTLVMEKSAKRQTNFSEYHADISRFPQANSTELPVNEPLDMDEFDIIQKTNEADQAESPEKSDDECKMNETGDHQLTESNSEQNLNQSKRNVSENVDESDRVKSIFESREDENNSEDVNNKSDEEKEIDGSDEEEDIDEYDDIQKDDEVDEEPTHGDNTDEVEENNESDDAQEVNDHSVSQEINEVEEDSQMNESNDLEGADDTEEAEDVNETFHAHENDENDESNEMDDDNVEETNEPDDTQNESDDAQEMNDSAEVQEMDVSVGVQEMNESDNVNEMYESDDAQQTIESNRESSRNKHEIERNMSDYEESHKPRQTTLEMYFEKVKQQNIERRKQLEDKIRDSIKAPTRDILNPFKVPAVPKRRMKAQQIKPKTQAIKSSVISMNMLPVEVLQDMKYKPPKRYRPTNASWITKRLYKFLESKLEPKYDYKARVRSEKLVETIYNFTKDIRRHSTAPADTVDALKHEMARLDVIKTHFEFYEFFHEYMPREVRVKVVPDVFNKIPLPKHGVFSDIVR